MKLPPEAYTTGEMFQRERQTVFARAWLPFAASAQLGQGGDFISHSMGGWPLLAVRGPDGVARAFRNTCRHQRMPVVEQASGRCAQFRCRYHGWTYDLAGQFLAAPPLVAPAEPLHLEAVETLERDGLVWVRGESGVGEPPATALAGAAFAGAITTDLGCNWKALVEAMLSGDGWRLLWPLALVRLIDGGQVLRQVVPRSFLRTRLVDLVFAAADLAALTRAAGADKAAAEALQARLATCTSVAPAAAVADFRRAITAACG